MLIINLYITADVGNHYVLYKDVIRTNVTWPTAHARRLEVVGQRNVRRRADRVPGGRRTKRPVLSRCDGVWYPRQRSVMLWWRASIKRKLRWGFRPGLERPVSAQHAVRRIPKRGYCNEEKQRLQPTAAGWTCSSPPPVVELFTSKSTTLLNMSSASDSITGTVKGDGPWCMNYVW